jgi:hypothetical protein
MVDKLPKKIEPLFITSILLYLLIKDFSMNNWKIEYEVCYQICNVSDGTKNIEYGSLIIEAASKDEAKRAIELQFQNILGFKLGTITKVWGY